MKVLFSNPPWWIENPDGIYTPKLLAGIRAGSRWPFTTIVRSRPGDFHFGDYLPYPFFLGAAATYTARETGATVVFRDSLALREGYPAYLRFLREEDFDYIVIESASPSWDHDAYADRPYQGPESAFPHRGDRPHRRPGGGAVGPSSPCGRDPGGIRKGLRQGHQRRRRGLVAL